MILQIYNTYINKWSEVSVIGQCQLLIKMISYWVNFALKEITDASKNCIDPNFYLCLKTLELWFLEKWAEGKKHLFLDFVTWMKL